MPSPIKRRCFLKYLYRIPKNILYEYLEHTRVVGSFELKEPTDLKYEREECPCCLNKIENSIFLCCGHKFCSNCVETFLKSNKCPDCRSNITILNFIIKPHTFDEFCDFLEQFNEDIDKTEMNDFLLDVIKFDELFQSKKWGGYI